MKDGNIVLKNYSVNIDSYISNEKINASYTLTEKYILLNFERLSDAFRFRMLHDDAIVI